jgi:hypothetical protein
MTDRLELSKRHLKDPSGRFSADYQRIVVSKTNGFDVIIVLK